MALPRPGEFPASLAVLGLLVRQRDTIAGVRLRLAEEHPNAGWPANIVHNSVSSHVAQRFVREVGSRGRSGVVYEATPEGVEHFRERLRQTSMALPAMRDALRAKLRYVEDEDGLEGSIREIRVQEEECVRLAEDARNRYRKAMRSLPAGRAQDWRMRRDRALMIDEVKQWYDRAKGLQRLRQDLEDPGGERDTLEVEDRDG